MTEKLENQSPIEGHYIPNEHDQERFFKSVGAACDYACIFNLTDFNVRTGKDAKGSFIVQLVYSNRG